MCIRDSVGGGIYTKAADVGADLVGKVEAGIPEDDPRNPAVIADNVGDNVGDVAGMGADLFESYVGSLVSALTLGVAVSAISGVVFPLAIAGCGLVASIIGTFFVKGDEKASPQKALKMGSNIAALLVVIVSLVLSKVLFGNFDGAIAVIAGLIVGVLIGLITECYTSADYNPVKKIGEQSETCLLYTSSRWKQKEKSLQQVNRSCLVSQKHLWLQNPSCLQHPSRRQQKS